MGEQVELLVEAHEEFESRSVEAAERAEGGVEHLREQVRDVQEQAREQVEA